MKAFINQFTAAMMLATFAGCTQGTPGGPGMTDEKGESPTYGQVDNTFNLSVPMTASSLQQGGQTEATVGIKRAKNFDEDVTLKFSEIPKGVTISPESPKVAHGESEANVTFEASDEAALGDFSVKVTGHPSQGSDANVDFKLTVVAKDTFTLNVSNLSLKQGEKQTVPVEIQRDNKFDQDVALNFGTLPKGVTLESDAHVIKHGENKANVEFNVADDAALGDFDVKVTGHPAKGKDASNEFNLSVVKQ